MFFFKSLDGCLVNPQHVVFIDKYASAKLSNGDVLPLIGKKDVDDKWYPVLISLDPTVNH